MSFLSEIHAYWASNTTLTAALPASKVWTGLAPEGTAFPYVIITPISLIPVPTTAGAYYAEFSFQISIFDSDPDNAESLGNTVVGQFDYQRIAPSTIVCQRTNGPVLFVDQDTEERVYHCLIEYTLYANRTLPQS